MLKRLTIVGLTVAGCAAVPPAGAKEARIGYIDVPRILEEFEGFKEARRDLDKVKRDVEEEAARRTAALRKMAQEIQEGGKMLSEAKRKEKIEAFEKRQREGTEWYQAETRKLQEREEGMIKRLEADVRLVLEKIGGDGGFSFVVRKDLFLYVQKDGVDLSDQVLAALRRQAKDAPGSSGKK